MAKVVTSHSISSLENAQNIPMILEKKLFWEGYVTNDAWQV